MHLPIYKSGQGYWTRVCTAWGVAVLVLAGCAWLWQELSIVQSDTIYWQIGVVAGIIVFFALFTYWILNKPRVADFMIATEAEMKKVNWPSKKEVTGSTWIVICGTFFMAAVLFISDIVFADIFRIIGILKG